MAVTMILKYVPLGSAGTVPLLFFVVFPVSRIPGICFSLKLGYRYKEQKNSAPLRGVTQEKNQEGQK